MDSTGPIQEELSDDFQISHRILIDPKQDPLRIDKFLMDRMKNVSRNRLQNAIRAASVLVNDKAVKPNYKIRPHDEIVVVVPKLPEEHGSVKPEDIPINIMFEDEDVLIVNKEAGMVVHPGIGNYTGTLVNALAYHYGQHDLPVMKGNLGDRIGLVHRIDKNTTGLLVVAKTEFAMSHLAKQFFDHTIRRKYQAIVWGQPEPEEGTINVHIGRHPRNRVLQHAFPDSLEGKEAITHYKLIEGLYYVSLLECELETGRTHQIRVHMKHVGHPLFSDDKYGGDRVVKGTVFSKYRQFVENCFKALPRQALHAKSLGFTHPRTGEEVYFESELPSDMAECLETWRKYVLDRKSKQNLL